mgnify:CR=1 FL=1
MTAQSKKTGKHKPYFGKLLVILIFAATSVLSVLVCVGIGSVKFSIAEVWRALWVNDESTARLLIWNLRFPRVLVGIRPTSPLFHFLAHIQEEVHRFAVSFHRQKRSKAFIHSELEQIEGVGDKTVQTLLRHFRTVEKVRAANIEELSALVGAAKAKKIRAFFEK